LHNESKGSKQKFSSHLGYIGSLKITLLLSCDCGISRVRVHGAPFSIGGMNVVLLGSVFRVDPTNPFSDQNTWINPRSDHSP